MPTKLWWTLTLHLLSAINVLNCYLRGTLATDSSIRKLLSQLMALGGEKRCLAGKNVWLQHILW